MNVKNPGAIISMYRRERNFPIQIVALQGTSSLQGQQHLPYLLQINVVLVRDRRASTMTSNCRALQLQHSLILCMRDKTYNYLASTVFTNEDIIRCNYSFFYRFDVEHLGNISIIYNVSVLCVENRNILSDA